MASFGSGQSMVVGRGLIEILPDFRKWGSQLASDFKVAKQQALGQIKPVEGAFKDSQGRLRAANGAFIKEYENGWKGAAQTTVTSLAKVGKVTSLVGLGVAVASVKMAGDFQAQTAVLNTAAGETVKGLVVVRKGLLNISQGTGTGLKNLTDGMYTIEKAGFRGANGLKILQAAAQGAKEENANLADVTNAMTSVMASYHLKAGSAVMVMNAMKTAAGEGKITMEEFSGALSTVLPIASANKISLAQVAGSMATLTQHGTSAREATHELASTIRALASPNMVAQREMARFGLSSIDVSTKLGKRGLTGTFDLLTKTILSKMGPSGKILLSAFEGTKQSAEDARIMISKLPPELQKQAKAFAAGTIELDDWKAVVKGSTTTQQPMLRNLTTLVNRSRGFSKELKSGGPAAKTYTDSLKKMAGGAIGLNTILQTTGESAAGNAERVKKIGDSFHHNTKDVEGWKTTANLLNTQLARMKQTAQVLAIEIGTKLIPVVSAAAGFFAEHRGILIGLVATILAFITVTAAAYIGMKLYAVGSAVATAAMFLFNIATMAQTDSLAVMRGQLALLWVQEKIVAIWTAITSTAFWGLAAAILANPITWVVVAIVALVAGIVYLATKTQFFQTVWAATWGFVKKVFTGFVSWFKDNWQLITFTIMTLGIGLAVAEIVRHWGAVKQAFADAFDWVKHNWPLLLAILGGPIGLATLYIVKHWKMISDGASSVYHDVINWFVRIGKDIGTFFSKLPGQLASFFSKAPSAVGGWFADVGKSIGSFFAALPGEIGKAVTGANNWLLKTGQNLIEGLFKGATDFFTKGIPGFFVMLWHGLVDYFKAVFGIHSPSTVFAAMGGDLILGLLMGMLRILNTIGGWLSSNVFTPINNFFKGVGSWLVSHGKSLIIGLVNGAKQGWANEVAWWTSRGKAVIGWFSAAGSWLVQHGREIINGLVNGAKAWWANETSWWTGRGRTVIGWFSAAGSWLVQHGREIINGLVNGAKAWWSNESSWWTGRGKAIVSFFSNAGTWLYSKGAAVINGLLSGLKSVWSTLTSWVSGIAKWIKDHKGPLSLDQKLLTPAGKALMGGLLKGLKIGFKDVGEFVYGTGNSISDITKQIGNMFLGDVGLGTSKGVEKYRDLVTLALRMLGQPTSYASLVLKRMNQESGGNPNIVNRWDSNWKAGHPSVGLMQVIRGTFASYAGKYRKTGPFEYGVSTNAMANIYAGLNYALHRYGSLSALGRPGGYDSGGMASGIGYMPKNILQPERVLSPRQTVAFDRLVGVISRTGGAQAGGGGGNLYVEHLHVEAGVIGSQRELENWFMTTTVNLKKKGRLK